MRIPRLRTLRALLLPVVLASACSTNPETEKVRHVQRGDAYAAEQRDAFAVVEYASAVKLDPKYGEARLKLAQTYERMGNIRAAAPEYIRAADALPDDREAQLKATQILLLAGQFEDAKARVAVLLQKNPKDVEALLLQANAMAALRDPAGAIAQIEEALKVSPDSSQAFVNLGAVRMQSGEAKEAEAAFRKAISIDPRAVDPRLALANFLWAAERAPEAEAMLNEALTAEPLHLLANRMLGVLYVATGRASEAERPLRVIAESSKLPAASLQLADYYASVGRNKDAVSLLTRLSSDPSSSVDAELRLAALDYVEGRASDAHRRMDSLLAKLPGNPQLLLMKAQWLTTENKLDEALERAKAAAAADPLSAPAHFALGVIHDRRRETLEAANAYTEVLRLNPRVAAAQVELSRLSLTSGDGVTALRYAEEARQTSPGSLEARVALARSLIAARNFTRAETEIAELLRGAPTAAVVHSVNGTLQASRNDERGARASFGKALELSPGFTEALAGLTFLDVTAKAPAQAVVRLENEVAKHQSPSSVLLTLLARAHVAAGDQAKAEQVLRRAVSADPRFASGYAMLGQLYLRQGRVDEARAEFEGIAQRNPSAVEAQTMVGWLFETAGKRDEAKKAYEAAVGRSDRSVIAENNLAFIYAEQGQNLDVALQLAQSAKRSLPDDPRVDDTLGWIYYKKDLPSLAVTPLEGSLKRQPDNAEVLYHLAATYAKLGDKVKAKAAIERALKLDPEVGGEDGRRVLAFVAQ